MKNLFLLFAMTWVVGLNCISNAPHENPLDPDNPNTSLTLKGQVLTLYPPYQGIPGVNIWLEPLHRFTQTNPAGEFVFNDLKSGDYTVIAHREGYDSDTVAVNLADHTVLEIYLDALPQFQRISLTTHRYGRYFPPDDLYFLLIDILVSDLDGNSDIVKMEYEIADLGFQDTLRLVEFPDAYTARFVVQRTPEDYTVPSLHTLIGKAFTFQVEDKPGERTTSPPYYLTRIVETLPVVVRPTGLENISTTQDTIQFQWESVYLPYPFTFRVEIYRLDFGVTTLVQRMEGIAADQTMVAYRNDLKPGDHFWVVYIVDEYGNTSRSREGAFRIVP
ncbi:MAG: carboxypeptidase-like regulatory domain-containing protein [Calditrichaeota bacterium]|nr:carboxypeptidase-like regulatory domain-containing protein [Calditrichota bacterium]